jgi:hypothetical protein
VHFILGEDDQDGLHVSHPLFSELEELVSTGEEGEMEWRERARLVLQLPLMLLFMFLIAHLISLVRTFMITGGSSLRKT